MKVIISPEWCAAMAEREDGAVIGAGSPSHPLRQGECSHEWREIESIGNSEYRTCLRCILCHMPGERDEASGEIAWPAT